MPTSPRAIPPLTISPSGGDVSTPPATQAAGVAPVPHRAPAAAPSLIPDPCPPIPAFLDRGWLGLTTAELVKRVNAALAEHKRRSERAARARGRAVARDCRRWLARDRKRELSASRARWAAWKAQREEQGCG